MKKLLTVLVFSFLFVFIAQAQTLPNTVLFFGPSVDPNGGLPSLSVEVGGAKLVGTGTYLGAVAHLSSRGERPFQLKTRVQFHLAQKFMTFRGAPLFWTGEVGPDFVPSPDAPPSVTNIGYSVGSGPMASIALGKQTYLMPHAEITKGSLQDLGWRAGILIGFGSE